MELLKLVIVDDEPILLQGLLDTYDWESMGFEVVGSAKSGVQALDVIRREQPHVVLTDIRMKQMTGLMVMKEIQKEQISCLFVVLSAYRDFEYAKHACDLGAYAYLLKPIDDEQLRSTMTGAYNTCIKQLRSEEKYESWEEWIIRTLIWIPLPWKRKEESLFSPSRPSLTWQIQELPYWTHRDMWIFPQRWSEPCRCWTMQSW